MTSGRSLLFCLPISHRNTTYGGKGRGDVEIFYLKHFCVQSE